jgi:two-component system, response regulator, stage 0 sporulation protein A
MKKALTVLIVEDDPVACKDFIDYAEAFDDITLIGVTNNSTKAIDYVKNFLPNVIILDLELHKGSGNGISFLQELQYLLLNSLPYILITTNNSSSVTYELARQLGTDFIMSKHQDDYSAKNVIDFIRLMKPVIESRSKTPISAHQTIESPALKNKRIVNRINSELNYIGISPKAIGYEYLVDAIQLVINQPTYHICSEIGKRYNKTDSSVERAMQNAINKTWRTSNIDDLLKYYTARISSDKGVPTMTEFIYFYAKKIKSEF